MSEQLTSWKEIANYLRVSVRTAQGWEKDYGLPVHRIGPRGRVFATADEIDAWQSQRAAAEASVPVAVPPESSAMAAEVVFPASAAPAPPVENQSETAAIAGRHRSWIALLIMLGIVALGLFTILPGPARVPAAWRIDRNALVINDARGKELWRTNFPDDLDANSYQDKDRKFVWLGDLDGDKTIETLFVVRKDPRYPESHTLICFGEDGMERWRFIPGRVIRTATTSLENLYYIPLVQVARIRGTQYVIVSAYHYLYYPSQITLLDSSGRVFQDYWHSGHLATRNTALLVEDLDRNGTPELYLGGVNQARRQATLVVLDPTHMTGAATEDNPDYQFLDLPPAIERKRMYFPRTRLNLEAAPYNVVVHVHPGNDGLTVDTLENFDPGGPVALWELDRWLRVEAVSFSDIFASSYERLRTSPPLSLADERRRLLGLAH